MKIAMLSPYSLSRPGGVQGQVLGLSRALGALGHDVTVLGPEDVEEKAGEDRVGTGLTQGDQVGDETSEMALSPEESGLAPEESGLTPEIYALGRPRGLRSNGSVAPVTISPMAAARAERFVRKGGFDVLHLHEPLAPMAPYGSILHASVPMVGTYHRAGVSRWVHVFKPLAQFVGYRLQVRVAVSEAAAETGRRSSGGVYEVLFNGVDMTRFDAAEDRARHLASSAADRPTILFLGRHEHRKGLSVLLDAFSKVERPAELWVAGDGPENEVQRRRHPQSDRVKWLGMISDEEVAARLLAADVLCAPSLRGESFGMVVLEGMAARCASPRPRRSRRPRHTPRAGRWTPWPSTTSSTTNGPSPCTTRRGRPSQSGRRGHPGSPRWPRSRRPPGVLDYPRCLGRPRVRGDPGVSRRRRRRETPTIR
jgi:phosphatidylinositol alpha-mannosyltransferase